MFGLNRKKHAHEPCYTYDEGWTIEAFTCSDCGQSHLSAVCFVLEHGAAKAIARLGHYGHQLYDEVYFEISFGDFSEDNTAWTGNVTFMVRLGYIDEKVGEAFSLCDPPHPAEPDSIFGTTLTREQGLQDNHIDDLWRIVDFIVLSPEYHGFVEQATDRQPAHDNKD